MCVCVCVCVCVCCVILKNNITNGNPFFFPPLFLPSIQVEFFEVVRSMGLDMPEKKTVELFQWADVDKSGGLDYGDFKRCWYGQRGGDAAGRCGARQGTREY